MIFIIIVLALMIPILAIILDSQIGKALASRLERGNPGGVDALTGERMAYLEGEVERLSAELHRLDEETRFVTRLLTERAEGDPDPGRTLPDPGRGASGTGGDDG